MAKPTKFEVSYAEYGRRYGISTDAAGRISRAGIDLGDEIAVRQWIKTRSRPCGSHAIGGQMEIPVPVQYSNNDPVGISALRAETEALRSRYKQAVLTGNREEARLLKAWQASEEQLRRSEMSFIELQQLQGHLVEWSKVEVFHSKMLAAFREAIEFADGRVVYRLEGLSRVEMLEELRKERETTVFVTLQELPSAAALKDL
jgi:hypothetical protein